MDPEAALAVLRDAMPTLRAWAEAEEWEVSPAALHAFDGVLTDVTEAFEALDGWMQMGGFPPEPWRPAYEAAR